VERDPKPDDYILHQQNWKAWKKEGRKSKQKEKKRKEKGGDKHPQTRKHIKKGIMRRKTKTERQQHIQNQGKTGLSRKGESPDKKQSNWEVGDKVVLFVRFSRLFFVWTFLYSKTVPWPTPIKNVHQKKEEYCFFFLER